MPSLRSGLSKENNTDDNWKKVVKTQADNTINALRKNSGRDIAEEIEKLFNNISVPKSGQGKNLGLKRTGKIRDAKLQEWFYDDKPGLYICNHETRDHMSSDIGRYIFCSVWAKVGEKNKWYSLSPKSRDYPEQLMPKHKNFPSGDFAFIMATIATALLRSQFNRLIF